MNSIRLYFLLLLFPLALLASCNGDKEENPRQVIAGESNKTWVSEPEAKDEEGFGERDDKMVFYANGTFQLIDGVPPQTGRWNYNANQSELEIVFDDRQQVKEVFHVQELENDKMVLHASDGSTLRLRPE